MTYRKTQDDTRQKRGWLASYLQLIFDQKKDRIDFHYKSHSKRISIFDGDSLKLINRILF